jgi:restriction system protein
MDFPDGNEMEFLMCYLCGVNLLKGKGGSISGREGFPNISPHGGFRKLRRFQCVQVVYDGTVIFCIRFIDKKPRTHDQENFLRQRKLCQWDQNDPRALAVRGKFRVHRSDKSDQSDRSDWSALYRFTELSAEELANTLICFINQASYLLWQQLKYLEKEFLRSGGFTQRMNNAL